MKTTIKQSDFHKPKTLDELEALDREGLSGFGLIISKASFPKG